MAPPTDISQTPTGPNPSSIFPSLLNATNPMRFGAPLSSTSVATPQFLLTGPLSSTSIAAPPLRVGIPTSLPGGSILSYAATSIPTVVPPIRNSMTGKVLPNFLGNQTFGFDAPAQPSATHQIYNVMAFATQDLTKLTTNPPRKLVLQVIANLLSPVQSTVPSFHV
jgi:hypothetical protein